MKVLHVIPSIAPVRGGPSQAVLDMVKSLRQNNIDAAIATTNDNGADLLDVPLQCCTDYEETPVWFFPRFSPKVHALREFAFSSQLTSWLQQNLHHYDLVHIHAIFSYPSTAAMAIARQQKIPYIVRPLGQLCQWSLQQSARKKQIYLNLIERANLNSSQALHFTSEQEQQEAGTLQLQAPGFVLPHGLSLPQPIPHARQQLRQHLNVPDDEPIILFLSRLHPKKGLDYLLPALAPLTHHRFTLVLAGSGEPDYEAHIRTLLAATGLHDRTHLVGFIQGETKNLFLQGSDLFALPSHSENFGIAALEALAAGLPVLTTPGVALAPFIEKHDLGFVTELTISEISKAFEYYLMHPQEIQQKGNQASQLISKQYTWEKISQRMKQVYLDILLSKAVRFST